MVLVAMMCEDPEDHKFISMLLKKKFFYEKKWKH